MTAGAKPALRRHVVDNPHGRDIAFEGTGLLSERHHDTGRVDIYATVSGRFVLRQRRSSRPGIVVEDRVEVGDDLQMTIERLRPGTGRNHILRTLGLSSEEEI